MDITILHFYEIAQISPQQTMNTLKFALTFYLPEVLKRVTGFSAFFSAREITGAMVLHQSKNLHHGDP
jgi:hypothetical protein